MCDLLIDGSHRLTQRKIQENLGLNPHVHHGQIALSQRETLLFAAS